MHVNTGHGYYTPTECCLTPVTPAVHPAASLHETRLSLLMDVRCGGCFQPKNDSFILGFCHRAVVVTVGTRIQPWASSGIRRLAERSFNCLQGSADPGHHHLASSGRHRSLRIVDYQRRPGCDHPRCRPIRISSSARFAFVRHCS